MYCDTRTMQRMASSTMSRRFVTCTRLSGGIVARTEMYSARTGRRVRRNGGCDVGLASTRVQQHNTNGHDDKNSISISSVLLPILCTARGCSIFRDGDTERQTYKFSSVPRQGADTQRELLDFVPAGRRTRNGVPSNDPSSAHHLEVCDAECHEDSEILLLNTGERLLDDRRGALCEETHLCTGTLR